MRVLVCGGRDYADRDKVFRELDYVHRVRPISALIEGGARGADRLAREWALARRVPVATYWADWRRQGRAAGPRRNRQMLAEGQPELVVAFPGGRGTADMVACATAAKLPVWTFDP